TAGLQMPRHPAMDCGAVVHVDDAAREHHGVERLGLELDLADMRDVDAHAIGDAADAGAVERHLALPGGERDAVDVSAGMLRQAEQHAAPAAAGVEHAVAGLQAQERADMREFALLRRLQILVGRQEDAGRVGKLAVEHQREDLGIVLVMLGDLGALEVALVGGAALARRALEQRVTVAHRRSRSMTMPARSSTVSTRSASNSSKSGMAMAKRSSMRMTVSIIASESMPRSRVSGERGVTRPASFGRFSTMMSQSCCATTSRVMVCVSGIGPPAIRTIIRSRFDACQSILRTGVRAA